jgi:hypothetical protein
LGVKNKNHNLAGALLSTGLFAVLAIALGWYTAHPVSVLPFAAATATLPLPTPAITYPPGPYVPLGPSRLGAVRRLDNQPQLRLGLGESPGFIEPSTDGVDAIGETGASGPIVVIELSTGNTQKITDDAAADPKLSSGYIVWLAGSKLQFLDRATGQLGTLGSGPSRALSLSGSVVVWESVDSPAAPGWALWSYDFSTDTSITVTASMNTSGPIVSGDWVAYADMADQVQGPDGVQMAGLHVINLKTREDLTLDHIRLPAIEPTPNKYYALDMPWVVWGSQAVGENPRLNVYNLDSRLANSVSLPSVCPQNVLPGPPVNIVASGGIVLFQDCADLGYDMHSGQFFALPLNQHSAQPANFIGWAFANGQLIWCNSVAGQTELYTAPINAAP